MTVGFGQTVLQTHTQPKSSGVSLQLTALTTVSLLILWSVQTFLATSPSFLFLSSSLPPFPPLSSPHSCGPLSNPRTRLQTPGFLFRFCFLFSFPFLSSKSLLQNSARPICPSTRLCCPRSSSSRKCRPWYPRQGPHLLRFG